MDHGKPVMNASTSLEITALLKRALEEDIGTGDVTTDAIVPFGSTLRGQIIAKQSGVMAGLDIARQVFLLLDDRVEFESHVDEGLEVTKGSILADIFGPGRTLLTGERTALNVLNRMSGIATLTRKFVDAVSHTKAAILDTRKTAPGLRVLDKLAVRRGGGKNHRMGLYDMVLIKDNHIDFAGSLTSAVNRVRSSGATLEIEVEARTVADVQSALDAGVQGILLDNMTLDQMRQCVKLNGGRAKLEASGNISLENVKQVAETGVDFISVGALTHSPPSFDTHLVWVG
jgi:nicotinate-nucleotide pyrophosphorylase (carboxylating)